MLSNEITNTLINIANIRSGLLNENFVSSPSEFNKFNDKTLGIPVLIPANKKLFDFDESHVFHIDKKSLLKTIYGHQNENYVGFKHSFYQFEFLSAIHLKKKYEKQLNAFITQNYKSLNIIKKLKTKFNIIGAFQTRNIPHYGHELIIERMLDKCDHLVVNPVIGPKKKGDVRVPCLDFVYKNLINSKYHNKVSFVPIYANMFYAGPREALHHVIIRKKMGFDLFAVGRDHAGAENCYKPEEAPKLVKKFASKMGIKLMIHDGAKFCKVCNKTILIGDCNHNINNLLDISGTDFRKNIIKKKMFNLADRHMQAELIKSNLEFFEK